MSTGLGEEISIDFNLLKARANLRDKLYYLSNLVVGTDGTIYSSVNKSEIWSHNLQEGTWGSIWRDEDSSSDVGIVGIFNMSEVNTPDSENDEP